MRTLRELVLDITDRCPMSCVHCSANSGPHRGKFISLKKAGQIMTEAVGLGLETLSLTGGEPLIHPHLRDIIRLAHSLGICDIRVFTSGSRLLGSKTAPIDDAYAKALVADGLQKVFFNLQGSSAESHERITLTEGSFRAVMIGAEACKRHELYVGYHFVPMKDNWHELPAVMALCTETGVDEIGVLRFVPQGRGASNREALELTSWQQRQLLEMVSRLIVKDHKPKLRLGCPFNGIKDLIPIWPTKRCPAATEMCHILIDGSVAPCSALKWHDSLKGGNVYDLPTARIWSSGLRAFVSFRSEMNAEYECTAQKLVARGSFSPVTHSVQTISRLPEHK